jgi:hypothetical protein
VLGAHTSTGVSLETLGSIEWSGPGEAAAKRWAAAECRAIALRKRQLASMIIGDRADAVRAVAVAYEEMATVLS